MSYPKALEEVGEELLEMELKNRFEARAVGVCDFCHRPPSAPICKFPRRHTDRRISRPEQLAL